MRQVRALLFDLGGVVINVDFGRVLLAWARSAGCDPAGLRERFTFDEAYQQHERGELDAAGYFEALRQTLGLRLSDEDFTAGWNDLYVGPVPGVPAMLAAAGQYLPLYAFTNSNSTHQREWSARYAGELSAFRDIFVSSDLGVRKPDCAAFAAVANRAGFRPAEILFFDDTAENVTGARVAGLQAVLVRSSDDIRSALHGLGIAAGVLKGQRGPDGPSQRACRADRSQPAATGTAAVAPPPQSSQQPAAGTS